MGYEFDKLVQNVANIINQNQQLQKQVSNGGIKRGTVSIDDTNGTYVNVEGTSYHTPSWAIDDTFADGDDVSVLMSDDGTRAIVVGRW